MDHRRTARDRRQGTQRRPPRPYRSPPSWVDDAKEVGVCAAVLLLVCLGIWVTIFPESLAPIVDRLPFQ